MSPTFTESVVEGATLNWFDELGCAILHGPDIAPANQSLNAWRLWSDKNARQRPGVLFSGCGNVKDADEPFDDKIRRLSEGR